MTKIKILAFSKMKAPIFPLLLVSQYSVHLVQKVLSSIISAISYSKQKVQIKVYKEYIYDLNYYLKQEF